MVRCSEIDSSRSPSTAPTSCSPRADTSTGIHWRSSRWLRLDVIDGLTGDRDQHRSFVENTHPSDKDHRRWQTMRPPVDLGDIERAIRQVTGTDPVSSIDTGAKRNDRLSIAILLAVELRAATAEQLAQRYRAASPASIRATARRGRVRLGADPAFARLRDRAMSQLFAA